MKTMRRFRALAFAGIAAMSSVAAAQTVPQTQFESARPVVPAGTQLHARLMNDIGSRISHAGDTFLATVTVPVYDNAGRTIIPAGSQLIGVVNYAERGRAFHREAPLSYSFTGIDVNGVNVPIAAVAVTSSQYTHRGGIWLRPEERVRAGSPMTVQLERSIPYAALRGYPSNRAIGGGPRK